jgi:dihydrofolate reductase
MQKNKPIISIIVAIAQNHAIGLNNQLLWHISNDLKRFKKITAGHTVIMGKRTLASLPNGPLPNRRNIILTDTEGEHFDSCETATSIPAALEMVSREKEVFVIGGGMVYTQFLSIADKLYLTIVNKDFEGDTFFPEIDASQWQLTETILVDDDPQNDFSYTFETYQRLSPK